MFLYNPVVVGFHVNLHGIFLVFVTPPHVSEVLLK